MNDIELRDNFYKAIAHYAYTIGPTPTLPIANYRWDDTRYDIVNWNHSSEQPTDEILKTYTVQQVNLTYSLLEKYNIDSTYFNGYHIPLSTETKESMRTGSNKWKTVSRFIFIGTKSGFIPRSIKCAMNVTKSGSDGYCRIYDINNVKEIASFHTTTVEPTFEIITSTSLTNLPEEETVMNIEVKIEGGGYVNIGDIVMLF